MLAGTRSVQRTVALRPEDRQSQRRRWHVLVDLVNEQCPASDVVVAEIGTASGYTAAHILKYCPQVKHLYAIDLKRPDPELDFLAGLPGAELRLGHSHEVAKDFPDGLLDLIFIDADHSEAAVRRDLAAWVPKVKPGGVIAGHDYGSHNHPGVEIAVSEFFRDHPHPVRLEANKVWWTIKAH